MISSFSAAPPALGCACSPSPSDSSSILPSSWWGLPSAVQQGHAVCQYSAVQCSAVQPLHCSSSLPLSPCSTQQVMGSAAGGGCICNRPQARQAWGHLTAVGLAVGPQDTPPVIKFPQAAFLDTPAARCQARHLASLGRRAFKHHRWQHTCRPLLGFLGVANSTCICIRIAALIRGAG